MGEEKNNRLQTVIIVMTLVVAIVGGGYLVVSDRVAALRAARQKTITLGDLITIHTSIDEPLTIVAEYVGIDGKPKDSAYLMFGEHYGQAHTAMMMGQPVPAGTNFRLHFGINADIVAVRDGVQDFAVNHKTSNGSQAGGGGYAGVLSLANAQPAGAVVDFESPLEEMEIVVERVGDRLVVRKMAARK